jgi:hypothetical protein
MNSLSDLRHRDFQRQIVEEERQKARPNPWYQIMKARDARNTNSNIVVTGSPGDGKSSLSLVAGEDLQPEVFVDHPQEAVDRYVTFSGGEFGRAIKASPDGAIVIGDEFGQQMHHRQFMSEGSIALSGVLQGFRFRRFKTFLNLPALRYLDPDAQGLLTFQVYVKEPGLAEVFLVTHPKFRGDDFRRKIIDRYHFRKPRPELWKVYLVKKIANQGKVIDKAIRMYDDVEGTMDLTDGDIASAIKKDPEKFQKKDDSGVAKWDIIAIMDQFHVGSQRAYYVKRRLEKG